MRIRADWRERLLAIVVEMGDNRKALSLQAKLNSTFLRDTLEPGGSTPAMGTAQKLSDGLNVKLTDWFIEPEVETPAFSRRAAPAPQQGTEDMIQVLGMAECGADGWALWNGEVVAYVPRPPVLTGVPKAYAVYVVGTSMEDRYHPGDMVYINPAKPVTPGSYVLVQMQPKEDGGAPKAVLKRLVKRSGAKVVLAQLSPAKTFDLKADEILSMHRVVGSFEA